MEDPGAGSMVGLGDIALLICIERRRPSALAEVCRRHGGALHAVTTRVCGPARAEAVVSEVLTELWRNPQRFDPDTCSLRAFLLAQARARAVAVGCADAGVTTSPPGAAALLNHQGDDHAGRVLADLPEAERAVLALACFGGFRCREIANALEEPELVVAARMRSGLRRLGQHPLVRRAR